MSHLEKRKQITVLFCWVKKKEREKHLGVTEYRDKERYSISVITLWMTTCTSPFNRQKLLHCYMHLARDMLQLLLDIIELSVWKLNVFQIYLSLRIKLVFYYIEIQYFCKMFVIEKYSIFPVFSSHQAIFPYLFV